MATGCEILGMWNGIKSLFGFSRVFELKNEGTMPCNVIRFLPFSEIGMKKGWDLETTGSLYLGDPFTTRNYCKFVMSTFYIDLVITLVFIGELLLEYFDTGWLRKCLENGYNLLKMT